MGRGHDGATAAATSGHDVFTDEVQLPLGAKRPVLR